MAGLVHLPDVEDRVGRGDKLHGWVQFEAQLAEHVLRHGSERGEVERVGVGGDVRLIDGPFEPRDVGKIRKLARRWIEGQKARELAAVAVHVAAS